MKITKNSVKRLRTISSKLFPDDDMYYAFIGNQYQVESTLELTEAEARDAIKRLSDELTTIERKQRRRQSAQGITGKHATPKQRTYIKNLFKDLAWDANRQWGFIEKQTGSKKSVDFLTPKEASKVISGLKHMISDGYPKKGAQ